MKKQTLLFLLMLMPLMASAEPVEIDGIYYNLNQNTKEAEVTNSSGGEEPTGSYTGDIVIPRMVNYKGLSYFVTSIDDWVFACCPNLTSVTLPNSVTSIKSFAFYNCPNLTSVTLPNKLTVINEGVFASCSSLTSITIPVGVKIIESYAFSGCSGLTSVEIPNSLMGLYGYAFSGCSGLNSVTIPDSVTHIGYCSFSGCSKLTSVTIGKSVKEIDQYAFGSCNSLADIFCYAEFVPTMYSETFYKTDIEKITLHVPSVSINNYSTTSPWSYFKQIVSINKCETPTITFYPNGKIKVESATEGATCITKITATNAEPITDEEISLNTPLTVYTVTSYATKKGYDDSEVATSTFRWEKTEGDMNGDGMVNISDVVKLVNMILGQ